MISGIEDDMLDCVDYWDGNSFPMGNFEDDKPQEYMIVGVLKTVAASPAPEDRKAS